MNRDNINRATRLLAIKDILIHELHELMDEPFVPSTTTTDRLANRIDKQVEKLGLSNRKAAS